MRRFLTGGGPLLAERTASLALASTLPTWTIFKQISQTLRSFFRLFGSTNIYIDECGPQHSCVSNSEHANCAFQSSSRNFIQDC